MALKEALKEAFSSNLSEADYTRVTNGLASAWGYEKGMEKEVDDYAIQKLIEWIENIVRGEEGKAKVMRMRNPAAIDFGREP